MAGKASFDNLFFELATLARELGDPAVFGMLEALARDLQLPLRAVVLGEFNAGKSTFINALLGESVVPTGIVPTTATLNRLVWSSERSVRIEQRSLGPDVLLAHSDLRAALANMNPALVDRVTVHAPLDLLRTVEIIDTPGFNSLDPAHSAVARRGIAGAQIALWVLDATQPFKDSERVIASEIAQRKLPTLVLVNKADRISDADRPAIVDHLRQALRLTGLTPANTPILFAAKLALAGLKGDASALAASGWESVRGALADLLVARSSAVRDATLRREPARVGAKGAGCPRETAK
jgi:small GTP-binding protein